MQNGEAASRKHLKRLLCLGTLGVIILLGLTACWPPPPEVAIWSEDFSDFDAAPYAWENSGCSNVDDSSGVLLLTEEVAWCRARFFLKQLLLIDAFTIEFDFRMGRSSTSGGDGFTLAFVRSYDYGTPGSNYVPNSGKWMDFEGASGYAVEFDTYHNSESDPGPENHVGLMQDSVTNHLAFTDVGDIEDSAWHEARIAFDNGYIEVYVDGVLVLSHTISDFQSFQGYFGFTSATGTAINRHEIDNIRLWDSFKGGQQGRFSVGSVVKVTGTGGSALRIRSSAAGDVEAAVPDGWVFEIRGGPQTAELNGTTYKWWLVRDAEYDSPGLTGWVAESYLEEVASLNLVPGDEWQTFLNGQAQAIDAVARARQYEAAGTEFYDAQHQVTRCLGFVRESYGSSYGWISARVALDDLESRGLFHSAAESWNPPVGALVFFDSNLNPQYDHVGLFLGARQVAHVEGDRKAHIRDLGEIVQYSYIDEYLGWAYPPEEWLEADDSLVAYYDFDDAVMTTLLDSSQYLNIGDIMGQSGVVTGVFGNAFSFDGVDDWVRVPDSASLRSTNTLTIDCWVKPASFPAAGMPASTGIVAYGKEWQGMWELRLMGDGALYFLLNWNSGSETGLISTERLELATWQHVVATFDGETARVYLDGSLVGEEPCAELVHPGEDSYLAIGLDFPGADEYFHGSLDDLRIYNEAVAP